MPEKILFVSQEIAPYLPSGPIANLGRKLPPAVMAKGFSVRTVTPKFGSVNERRNQLHEVIRLSGMNIAVHDGDHPLIIKVASLQPSRIQAYFIDNDDYFQKLDSDTDPVGSDREDNDERIAFFSRGANDMLERLKWEPAVVQCSGWFTALMPFYLRSVYKGENGTPTPKWFYYVLPGGPQHPLPETFLDLLAEDNVPAEQIEILKEGANDVSLLHKFAILNSDGVIFDQSADNTELIAFAEKHGKPHITFDHADVNADDYISFYKENGAQI